MENKSNISGFVLSSFPGVAEDFDLHISITLFVVYLTSSVANGTVIALIACNRRLYQPMYILISSLAMSDLLFDTTILPKIIASYWFGNWWISFSGCIFQIFSSYFMGCFDSYVLFLMAVDRYVAICKPLRYSDIITNRRIVTLCCFFFLLAASIGLIVALLDSQLEYCGHNINSCFCSNLKLLSLACSDVTFLRNVTFCFAMFILLLPLLFIIFSYGVVIRVTFTQTQDVSRRRAFYTCSTQLSVICLFFIPRIFICVADQVRLILNEDLNALLSCIYTFIPHMANPIIYCLRTKEIRRTFRNHVKRRILKNTIRISAADVN
ncbi:olfactory receptor 56A4-like [Gastrophryne carolinensis]